MLRTYQPEAPAQQGTWLYEENEDQKRQKAGDGRSKHHHPDGDHFLFKCHDASHFLSSGFLSRVSTPSMASMAGMIKSSGPNSARQSTEMAVPTMALV